MSEPVSRRAWLGRSTAALIAGPVVGAAAIGRSQPAAAEGTRPIPAPRRMKLGLVTYNVAADWDLKTIIERCRQVGLTAVEFRTTHKHGVEPSLSKADRQDVRKRCADGGLVIWGLGSACEYHAPDPDVVARNIEETKRFIDLAHDLGAVGVKVRPNGLPKEVPVEKTLEQIGRSLRTCGEAAAAAGVEIWCEMHGSGTSQPAHMRRIMDLADHPAVGVTWNSNRGVDDQGGSVRESFALMRPKIYSVHINELIGGYPYRELFTLLNETGYDRYTLIEVQTLKGGQVEDTVRFLKYYKALWEELSRPA